MTEPLDLDALELFWRQRSGSEAFGTLMALVAELRATCAERDEIREDYARMLKWHDLAVARAERTEAAIARSGYKVHPFEPDCCWHHCLRCDQDDWHWSHEPARAALRGDEG